LEESRAKAIVESILLDQPDLFLVELKLKGAIGNRKLLVFIDGDSGLSIDRCGSISRSIANRLEEDDIIEGKYILEVSSPGLDFPLTNQRQYRKNIGRNLSLRLKEGKTFEGELLAVDDEEGLSLQDSSNTIKVSWGEIEETKIKISFK